MVVLILTAVPVGLRGHVTRWLLEIAPGVYVGKVSARVREELWDRVREFCEDGSAFLVYPSDNEQGLQFRTWGHSWTPVDHDGITLMRRRENPVTTSREPLDISQGGAPTAFTSAEVRRRRQRRRRFKSGGGQG